MATGAKVEVNSNVANRIGLEEGNEVQKHEISSIFKQPQYQSDCKRTENKYQTHRSIPYLIKGQYLHPGQLRLLVSHLAKTPPVNPFGW